MTETTWRLPKGAYLPAKKEGSNPLVTHEQIVREAAEKLGVPMEPEPKTTLRLYKAPEMLADIEIPLRSHEAVEIAKEAGMPIEVRAPDFWSKGALLNVRNAGEHYIVTLYPEEYDPRYPERALKFTNTALCQDFVSAWYQREHFDPRAF